MNKRSRMCSKECFHFTNLDSFFGIMQYGLLPLLGERSKLVKDTAVKVSFSDGRYAAAGLMANFYEVYCNIKKGKRDMAKTDSVLAEKVCSSDCFEDFFGDGIYLMFDGSDIENTGGMKGNISPYDAGTTQAIDPERLKVCVLIDVETGEISYSKYEYAFYLMEHLTARDKKRLGSPLLLRIKQFQQDHIKIKEKFLKHVFSEKLISLDEFQVILKGRHDKEISNNEVRSAIIQDKATKNTNTAKSLERTKTNFSTNFIKSILKRLLIER